MQRRSSCDTEALPIQLDDKDVNLNLDLTEVAEKSSRKIYDKINVSRYVCNTMFTLIVQK